MANNESLGKDNKTPKLDEKILNLRTGYQIAVDLWISEGQQIWSRFNAMLVANSILVVGLHDDWINNHLPLVFKICLCFVGLFLCLVWFLLMNRDFEYQKYLVWSAREIEEQFLKPVKTISRGGDFVDGNCTLIILNGDTTHYRMNWVARSTRDKWAVNTVIFLFFSVYIFTLLHP
jgi:hypothetical protein